MDTESLSIPWTRELCLMPQLPRQQSDTITLKGNYLICGSVGIVADLFRGKKRNRVPFWNTPTLLST